MSAIARTPDWGHLLTAMLTPFDADGKVHYAELERVAHHLVDDQKCDGLVVCGTTGEAPTLKQEEKLRILEVVLQAVGHKASVIFGCGTYDTAESILLAQSAEKRGAHGLMAVTPYYSKPGQAGVYAHFKALSEATKLPLMVYNIAGRTGTNIETDTLLRLAHLPGIVAVKEASGDMNQIADVCGQAPEGFLVYSGDDALTLPILALGGMGVVSVAAHVVGASLHEMLHAFKFRPAKAAVLHRLMLPVFRAVFSAPSPTPIKYALSLKGFDCEQVRLPLVALSDPQKAVVRQALEAFEAARSAV